MCVSTVSIRYECVGVYVERKEQEVWNALGVVCHCPHSRRLFADYLLRSATCDLRPATCDLHLHATCNAIDKACSGGLGVGWPVGEESLRYGADTCRLTGDLAWLPGRDNLQSRVGVVAGLRHGAPCAARWGGEGPGLAGGAREGGKGRWVACNECEGVEACGGVWNASWVGRVSDVMECDGDEDKMERE